LPNSNKPNRISFAGTVLPQKKDTMAKTMKLPDSKVPNIAKKISILKITNAGSISDRGNLLSSFIICSSYSLRGSSFLRGEKSIRIAEQHGNHRNHRSRLVTSTTGTRSCTGDTLISRKKRHNELTKHPELHSKHRTQSSDYRKFVLVLRTFFRQFSDINCHHPGD